MPDNTFDFYTDGMIIIVTGNDVHIQFLLSYPQTQQVIANGRMAHSQAKILTIVLKKSLRALEDRQGKIPLDPAICEQAGISVNEDW